MGYKYKGKSYKEKLEEKKEHHKKITESLIAALEKGTAPWQLPYNMETAKSMIMPLNGFRNRRYTGINAISLMLKAQENGYEDPRWYTYKEILILDELAKKENPKAPGIHVRRGEKGTLIEFWEFEKKVKEKDENGNMVEKSVHLDIPIFVPWRVFNAAQIENVPELKQPEITWKPLERAETILKANGVPIEHNSPDYNFYSPSEDKIHLTPRNSFNTADDYYSVALHEAGHSTGHETRLNRQIHNFFGSEEYAREELRAEIGSMFLCSDIGLKSNAIQEQGKAYVKNWIQVLKKDPEEIAHAAHDANNICRYLYGKEKEYLKTHESENTKLFPLVSITLNRGEGPSELCRKSVVVHSFKEADAWFHQQALTAPAKAQGYDKCDFTVVWNTSKNPNFNGVDSYTGRFDLTHDDLFKCDLLQTQIVAELRYSAGVYRPEHFNDTAWNFHLKNIEKCEEMKPGYKQGYLQSLEMLEGLPDLVAGRIVPMYQALENPEIKDALPRDKMAYLAQHGYIDLANTVKVINNSVGSPLTALSKLSNKDLAANKDMVSCIKFEALFLSDDQLPNDFLNGLKLSGAYKDRMEYADEIDRVKFPPDRPLGNRYIHTVKVRADGKLYGFDNCDIGPVKIQAYACDEYGVKLDKDKKIPDISFSCDRNQDSKVYPISSLYMVQEAAPKRSLRVKSGNRLNDVNENQR
jgi:antirestriction protein ArdC